jgi:peptidoglycan/LPS O-acetylase OafA/YrhL
MYLYHLPVLLLFDLYAPAELGFVAFPLYLAVLLTISIASFVYVERQGPLLGTRTTMVAAAVSRGRA